MAIQLLNIPLAHTTPSSHFTNPAAADDTVISHRLESNWSLLAVFRLYHVSVTTAQLECQVLTITIAYQLLHRRVWYLIGRNNTPAQQSPKHPQRTKHDTPSSRVSWRLSRVRNR